MKKYFYETISRCFDTAIYTRYGSVAVSLYGNKEDTGIRYVAYDIPHNQLMQLSEEEQKSHVKLEKIYDISDVNFDEKMSVLKKISELVTNFEVDVYSH